MRPTFTKGRRLGIIGFLLLGVLALGAAAQTSTLDRWREDFRVLVETLESEHANLYHTVSQTAFRAGIDSLAARAGQLDDNAIMAELARLVATIGDGHTLVNLIWDRRLSFRRLPIRFERAVDGLVILEGSSDFTDLLGARVIRLGQLSADDALAAVRPLYSHDNEWTSLQATDLLQIPEILHATGITQSVDSVELEVETRSGELRAVTLAALTQEALGSLDASIDPDTAPLWLRNREDRYWLALLPQRRAVYVQFNGADYDKEGESLAEFGRRMEQTVQDKDVDRLILDLRWNDGGSRWRARHLLNAVIRVEGYFRAERVTRERQPSGRVFTIIGPRTFSAAAQFALDLDLHTNTVFVGEPTGGKPNHYGEVGRFRLPNSGLEVRFSRFYHQASHPRDTRPAIFPDVTALPSIDDYRTGRDRALEAIWAAFPAPQRLTLHETSDRYPAWSPDGKRIAFESDRDGNWELYLMLSDGSQVSRITEHSASDRYPAWDPGGRKLVFQSDRSGTPDLYILELASGEVSRLTQLEGEEISPAWSPDGRQIAFSLLFEGQMNLFVVGADGTGTVKLTQNEFRDVWPRWSPAGGRLAFFSRRHTGGRDDELYVLDVTTQEITRITNSPGHDFCPAWSPDGNHLAAAKITPGGQRSIRILDLLGEPLHEFGAGFERITEPNWSADGKRIAFAGRLGGAYDIFVYTLP